jgi:SAM-dependent methyltransferase
MSKSSREPNWYRLLEDYQSLHLRLDPLREVRFDTIMDVLDAGLPSRFVALDLGTGPGPLAKRILERFPRANVVLIDHDRALLEVGRRALSGFGNRAHPLLLDLGKEGWEKILPFKKVDAVVSSSMSHDLTPGAVRRLYHTIYRILRPGGLLINSDYIVGGEKQPRLAMLVEQAFEVQIKRGYRIPRKAFLQGLEEWWQPIRRYAPLHDAIARRDRIARKWRPRKVTMNLPSHFRALRESGFREVKTVWQYMGSPCILVAVK